MWQIKSRTAFKGWFLALSSGHRKMLGTALASISKTISVPWEYQDIEIRISKRSGIYPDQFCLELVNSRPVIGVVYGLRRDGICIGFYGALHDAPNPSTIQSEIHLLGEIS